MKKVFLAAIASLSLLLMLLPACQAAKVEAGLGQEFQLKPGQQAVIVNENLSLEFVRVSEDSRCPTGATCIWEGRDVCLLRITKDGSASELSLIQMGSSDQAAQDYLGYNFVFNLTPYPVVNEDIDAGAYRLILKVTHSV